MVKSYIPKRGDLVWMEFNPQAGHEQAGKRPALVISPERYNQKTGLLLACPITSHIKGYPFEVQLPPELSIQGVVLADQIKNLDWQVRKAQFVCNAPENTLQEVVVKVRLLIDF